MSYNYYGPIRCCEDPGCGKPYKPKTHNQKYCSTKCKQRMTKAEFKRRNPEYWVQYMRRRKEDRIKKPRDLKPPYKAEKCKLCKRALGHTWNRNYHNACLSRISKVFGYAQEECYG